MYSVILIISRVWKWKVQLILWFYNDVYSEYESIFQKKKINIIF